MYIKYDDEFRKRVVNYYEVCRRYDKTVKEYGISARAVKR